MHLAQPARTEERARFRRKIDVRIKVELRRASVNRGENAGFHAERLRTLARHNRGQVMRKLHGKVRQTTHHGALSNIEKISRTHLGRLSGIRICYVKERP